MTHTEGQLRARYAGCAAVHCDIALDVKNVFISVGLTMFLICNNNLSLKKNNVLNLKLR